MSNLYEMIKKADARDAEAQYNAADHILQKISLDKNNPDDKEIIARAIEYLRNAAMDGYFQGVAALELGEQYYSGQYIEKDYRQAVIWFRTATQKRHPIGYYRLGCCFYHGHGISQSYAKAFDSFFKGALTGYINNYIKLGDHKKDLVFIDYCLEKYEKGKTNNEEMEGA